MADLVREGDTIKKKSLKLITIFRPTEPNNAAEICYTNEVVYQKTINPYHVVNMFYMQIMHFFIIP